MEYQYLVLVLSGLLFNRYVMPFLDILSELFNYWTGSFATKMNINTQRAQLNFKKEMLESETKESLMGFHYEKEESIADEELEDEDEEDYPDEDKEYKTENRKRKIGFRGVSNNRKYTK